MDWSEPLKIAHIADTHIGMENYGRLNPETGLNQRLHDFLASLDQALDEALAAGVHLVVIAGDIYKSRDPSATHQREFARRIHRLAGVGVPVFIAAGNHDVPLTSERATSIDIFRTLAIPNVTVARTIGTHQIQTVWGPVQILAFPWLVRSLVLARDEFKNRTISDLNQVMIDLNRGKLLEEAESLRPDLPTLIVGHAHLFGARVGAERLLTLGSDPEYDLQTFSVPQVDYVALGHIHKHQAPAYGSPPIVYSGSIDRVDFGEEHEDKGWVYVEIPAKGRAEWQFKKVSARPFLTVSALAGLDNPTEDVVKAIARDADRITGAVVRVRIEVAPEAAHELREADIYAQLKQAYFLAPIEKLVRATPRDRLAGFPDAANGLPPLDALKLYLAQKSVPAARVDVLLSYARGIMERVERPELTNGDPPVDKVISAITTASL